LVAGGAAPAGASDDVAVAAVEAARGMLDADARGLMVSLMDGDGAVGSPSFSLPLPFREVAGADDPAAVAPTAFFPTGFSGFAPPRNATANVKIKSTRK
jgi:hypothetical protein